MNQKTFAPIIFFVIHLAYEKLFQKMEMAVQDVENLGIFIEYEEDESVSGLPVSEKINKMKENLKDFGFVLGDNYGCKKPFMMLHK